MILMITSTYPTTSAVEYGKAVVKNFQEKPYPDSIKLIGPYVTLDENGCKAYVIYEIEDGKADEAFTSIMKRVANYMPVPGFGWKEENMMTMEEAMPLIGLQAP